MERIFGLNPLGMESLAALSIALQNRLYASLTGMHLPGICYITASYVQGLLSSHPSYRFPKIPEVLT